MRNIKQALQEHKEFLIQQGYKEENLLGIFLYGSQNYGLANDNSDVDTKAIIIPSFEDLCLRTPVVKELFLPNEEHCAVMDIRHLVANFRKQNINFLEILFTEHFIINEKFRGDWEVFFKTYRDYICRYDQSKAIKSIKGQAIHTLKQNPLNGKKVSNGVRLQYFLQNYILGKGYQKCIHPQGPILEVCKFYKEVEALPSPDTANELIAYFENLTGHELETSREDITEPVDKIMNNGILELVKLNLD